MKLCEVRSGGQTGADIAALRAAKSLGISTAGWIPSCFRTLHGPRPEYGAAFGLIETPGFDYSHRTMLNVRDSDATLRLARNFDSPGERCTKRAIAALCRPFLDVYVDPGKNRSDVTPAEIAIWIGALRPAGLFLRLNVAGNSERMCPGIEQFVEELLIIAFGACI